ncbi:MAG: thioredoxin [Chloroflexota bacterium]|jgi:thioredoxin 1|nr:thioredoxin [Chloroflexota bacterium]
MSNATVELTDVTFVTKVESDKAGLVLVDFWAEWCGPCRQIGPIVEEIATENKGKLTVGKVDVDANQGTAQKFGVMSIPTLMLFKNGKLVERMVGAMPKNRLMAKIAPHMA